MSLANGGILTIGINDGITLCRFITECVCGRVRVCVCVCMCMRASVRACVRLRNRERACMQAGE